MKAIELGKTYFIELFDCNYDKINSVQTIRNAAKHLIKDANLTFIKDATYQYSPQGVTVIAIIAESHIAIHSWPEHKFVSIDLFSCSNEEVDIGKLSETAKEIFEAKKSSFKKMKRPFSLTPSKSCD